LKRLRQIFKDFGHFFIKRLHTDSASHLRHMYPFLLTCPASIQTHDLLSCETSLAFTQRNLYVHSYFAIASYHWFKLCMTSLWQLLRVITVITVIFSMYTEFRITKNQKISKWILKGFKKTNRGDWCIFHAYLHTHSLNFEC
jgi:hypothetical protein